MFDKILNKSLLLNGNEIIENEITSEISLSLGNLKTLLAGLKSYL